jgi:uncharacterized BrkB/YihY/UPF0761 family membrane protein
MELVTDILQDINFYRLTVSIFMLLLLFFTIFKYINKKNKK